MSQTIFRSIELDHGQTITLGEPIPPDAQPLLAPDGPGRWTALPGSYSGAASITIVVGAGDAVQRMEFAYAEGTDYAEMLENFENEIGPPDSQRGTAPARQSVWQDAATRFVLREQPDGTGSSVGSKLSDLAGDGE
jgi:hypothetical protein